MTKFDSDGKIKYYITYVTDEEGHTSEYKYDAQGNLLSVE